MDLIWATSGSDCSWGRYERAQMEPSWEGFGKR